MVWQTMPTFVDGNVLTAAQLTILVGNLNETAPAKATTAGSIFAATGANTIAQRTPTTDFNSTTGTTTSTSYTSSLTGGGTTPTVTMTTGAKALIITACGMFNTTANAESYVSVNVTGATTSTADDTRALRHTSSTASAQMMGSWAYVYSLTAGSSTFALQYHCSSGTSSFFDRRLSIVSF